MNYSPKAIEQIQRRLFFVPISGLRAFAEEHGMSTTGLGSAPKKSIIQWLVKQRGISIDALEQLFSDYSYGKRVSLIVLKLGSNLKRTQLAKRISALSVEEPRPETNRHIFDLRFIEIQESGQLFEIPFKFSRRRFYLSADSEESEEFHELNFGVVWVEKGGRYLALLCKDEFAIDLVVEVLKKDFKSNLIRIALPKKVVNKVFDITKSRRQVYTSDDDITRAYSGKGVYSKVESEIASREAADHRSSSLYTDKIGSHNSATFGVTSRKGKLYIQNHVSKSDLQTWSQDIIEQILIELENLAKESPQTAFDSIKGSLLYEGIRKSRIVSVGAFIEQTIHAYKSDGEIQLTETSDIVSLLNDQDYFIKVLFPHCEECHHDVFCQCGECSFGIDAIDIEEGECPSCQTPLEGTIECQDGHTLPIKNQLESYLFSPRSSLVRALKEAFETLGIDTSLADKIRVFGGILKVSPLPVLTGEVRFDEISEFSSIPKASDLKSLCVKVPELTEWIMQLKEKCKNGVTSADCTRCLTHPVQGLCLMRIWHPTLPGYLPRPHGANELGDINANLTVNGRRQQMVGIIKRRNAKVKGLLGHKQKTGSEILRQTVTQFIRDARASILAVVVPQDIDPQFKADLTHLVRAVGKQISFWGTQELGRVAYASAPDIVSKGHALSWYVAD